MMKTLVLIGAERLNLVYLLTAQCHNFTTIYLQIFFVVSLQESNYFNMFSLTELAPFNQHQCRFKLLKPWWEVFMDYFVVLMLLISVLACTEHLSRDKVVCLPLLPLESAGDQASAGVNGVSTPSSEPPIKAEDSNFQSGAKGRQTHLAFQQYVYISQVLYVQF